MKVPTIAIDKHLHLDERASDISNLNLTACAIVVLTLLRETCMMTSAAEESVGL